MSRVIILLLLFGAIVASAVAQTSSVPPLMNYQGKLTKPDGSPVEDGQFAVRFSIHDALTGGTERWFQTMDPVLVRNGVFSVLLGSGNPLSSDVFDGVRYLEIKVGTADPLSPRQPIVSVGYSFVAQKAEVATQAQAFTSNADLVLDRDLQLGAPGEKWIFHPTWNWPNRGEFLLISDQDANGGWNFNRGLAIHQSGYVQVRGDLQVLGSLSKSGGSFRIDHPQDPANKYLYHSFVESPDMKNVYDGVATMDKDGTAVVELPSYFQALNRDFRYQLTCIGGHAPVYVAQKVKANSFRIAGGQPGQEVSWQVTGIRKDPWAEQNRIVPEVSKPKEERGTYLFPNGYPSRLTDSKRGKE